jgi:hypothetical protein
MDCAVVWRSVRRISPRGKLSKILDDDRQNSALPTLAWTIQHLDDYVSRRIDIDEFWQPFPGILQAYLNHPVDPHDRLPYYWREMSRGVGNILRLGYEEDDDFRNYTLRWLDALRMDKERWDAIVDLKGRPLVDNVPDWAE